MKTLEIHLRGQGEGSVRKWLAAQAEGMESRPPGPKNLGVVVHTRNPSAEKMEAGRSLHCGDHLMQQNQ